MATSVVMVLSSRVLLMSENYAEAGINTRDKLRVRFLLCIILVPNEKTAISVKPFGESRTKIAA
jgi:hypothetical protein